MKDRIQTILAAVLTAWTVFVPAEAGTQARLINKAQAASSERPLTWLRTERTNSRADSNAEPIRKGGRGLMRRRW